VTCDIVQPVSCAIASNAAKVGPSDGDRRYARPVVVRVVHVNVSVAAVPDAVDVVELVVPGVLPVLARLVPVVLAILLALTLVLLPVLARLIAIRLSLAALHVATLSVLRRGALCPRVRSRHPRGGASKGASRVARPSRDRGSRAALGRCEDPSHAIPALG
jgi:hypothetical protein